jgi:hypothetical protein
MTSDLPGDYQALADAPLDSGPVLFALITVIMFFSFLLFGRKK